ncbi:hypothetical protein AACH10_21395 [Ideonella sp. DXS22W]|uniref:Transposase n=1 Tax=Pseudaquabacterium inlustre TaxID=2984192 RepID=A0ABU9CNU4_9BURK
MKRQVVEVMVTQHQLSISRACSATGLPRAAYCKVLALPQDKDAEVIDEANRATLAIEVAQSTPASPPCCRVRV